MALVHSRHAIHIIGAVTALALGCAPLAARADSTGVATGIIAVRNAPVSIQACAAGWTDLGYSMLSVGESVSFVNRALEPVVAVRFRFELRTTFGEELDTHYGTSEGLYSTNVLIESTRHGDKRFYPAPHSILCSVDTVKFRSGRMWQVGDPPVPLVTSSTSESATTSSGKADHPATCKVTLADKSQIDIPWENAGCAAARRAFVARAHPATCKVTLADKSEIEIPWDNPGCAAARKARDATSTTPLVSYDYDGQKQSGHPVSCSIVTGDAQKTVAWASDECAPARAQWAAEPDWMHAHLWDDHDSAPENLVDGHPKYCDPFTSGLLKGIHYVWSMPICKNARTKWDVIHGNAPPPTR